MNEKIWDSYNISYMPGESHGSGLSKECHQEKKRTGIRFKRENSVTVTLESSSLELKAEKVGWNHVRASL